MRAVNSRAVSEMAPECFCSGMESCWLRKNRKILRRGKLCNYSLKRKKSICVCRTDAADNLYVCSLFCFCGEISLSLKWKDLQNIMHQYVLLSLCGHDRASSSLVKDTSSPFLLNKSDVALWYFSLDIEKSRLRQGSERPAVRCDHPPGESDFGGDKNLPTNFLEVGLRSCIWKTSIHLHV